MNPNVYGEDGPKLKKRLRVVKERSIDDASKKIKNSVVEKQSSALVEESIVSIVVPVVPGIGKASSPRVPITPAPMYETIFVSKNTNY